MKSLISKKNRSSRNRLSRKRLSSFSRKIQRGGNMTVDEAIKTLTSKGCPKLEVTNYLKKHPRTDLVLFVNGAINLHKAWNTPKEGMIPHETKSWYYCLEHALEYDNSHYLPKDISWGRSASSRNVPVGLRARTIPKD